MKNIGKRKTETPGRAIQKKQEKHKKTENSEKFRKTDKHRKTKIHFKKTMKKQSEKT